MTTKSLLFSAAILSACARLSQSSLPDNFPDIINSAVRLRGGGTLTGMTPQFAMQVEQQLKRVIGLGAGQDLNISAVRETAPENLYRLLLLAVMGNFTSSAADAWMQPCKITVDAHTGKFNMQSRDVENTTALKVLIVILCGLQAKRFIAEKWLS